MSGWAAAVQAGLEVGGAIYQNWQNKKAARTAYKRAKHMYRRRYQWTVRDMRKAGLNPILAAQGGLGGGGSTASPQMARIESPAPKNFASNAMQAARLDAEIDNIRQNTETQASTQFMHNELGMKAAHEGRKAHYDAITARELARQAKTRTARFEKYGESATGSNLHSFEQMLNRVIRNYGGSGQ